MKKTSQIIRHQLLAVFVASMLILQLLPLQAHAWEGNPQTNAIHITVGDTEVLAPNENLVLELNEAVQTYPGSLLCKDLVYLPALVFLELGLDVRVDNDSHTIFVDRQEYGDLKSDTEFSRAESKSAILTEDNFLENLYSIVVNGKTIAVQNEWVLYNEETYPSTITIAEAPMGYLPAQLVMEALCFDTALDLETAQFSIARSSDQHVGLENFQKVNQYSTGQFTDVVSTAWYSDKIQDAFVYGLMTGKNESAFDPDGPMSVAEAITIAARLNSTYYGNGHKFLASTPWYQAYVEYALENQIISAPYANYDAPISRGEFAIIAGNVFPLPAINEIEENAIPDVAAESSYYKAVYQLYRSGVLSGTDSIGTFNPDAKISRAEVSAILCNMVDSSQRKLFTLKAPIFPESISVKPASVTVPAGSTQKIFASIAPSNTNRDNKITWTSSDPKVATVSASGVVSGISTGDTTITATTANGKSASCTVSVNTLTSLDILFARDSVIRLQHQLKFPDTLQLHGIWAFSYYSDQDNTTNMVIYIYYSALNPLGLRSRGEYQAFYDLGAKKFLFSDSQDSVSSHSVDRVVDINKVLRKSGS